MYWHWSGFFQNSVINVNVTMVMAKLHHWNIFLLRLHWTMIIVCPRYWTHRLFVCLFSCVFEQHLTHQGHNTELLHSAPDNYHDNLHGFEAETKQRCRSKLQQFDLSCFFTRLLFNHTHKKTTLIEINWFQFYFYIYTLIHRFRLLLI